jgi:GntR family transcriptional regulator
VNQASWSASKRRPLTCRRRLVRLDGEASEIVTWWLPPALASGTSLDQPTAIRGGIRSALAKAKGVRIDHVIERVTARHPSSDEAKLLGIGKTAPLLAVYVTAREADGHPVLALDVAMPGDVHELEDAYPVG